MNRQDSWSKRKASRFANALRDAFFDDGMRDTGCTPKALKRECIPYLIPFNGLHRFIPALLKSAGFKITEVGIQHRPRRTGVSKYTNWKRALRGIYDLFGVKWLISRRPVWPRK
jgi:dolichol-phosphate mannosyltransferase